MNAHPHVTVRNKTLRLQSCKWNQAADTDSTENNENAHHLRIKECQLRVKETGQQILTEYRVLWDLPENGSIWNNSWYIKKHKAKTNAVLFLEI